MDLTREAARPAAVAAQEEAQVTVAVVPGLQVRVAPQVVLAVPR